MNKQLRHLWRLLGVALCVLMVAAACGGDDNGGGATAGSAATTSDSGPAPSDGGGGGTVEVLAKWTGAELDAGKQVMDAFTKKTGIQVNLQGVGDDLPTILTTRVEGGNPPDVAQLPQPGLLTDLAKRGALKPIGDVVGKAVDDHYAPVWKELGSYNGTLYGVWFKAANKSTVWYNPKTVSQAGVEPPKTWDEWVSQAQTLANSGITPLSVGAADGWVLSDWFENVYLRMAGTEKYDQLTKHEIPWTDQSVKDALSMLKQLIGVPQNVAGGLQGALQVNFETSVKQVFGDNPQAAEVYEGDFVGNTIRSETAAQPGTDFDFFPFPSINGSKPAVMGGGDVVVMLKDNPNARKLIEYLATPEAAEIWAKLGGFSSPNKDVDPSVYPDDITRRAAQQLTEADTFRFDMSDNVPAAFGSTKGSGIWGRLQDWLANPDDIDGITSRLEAEAQAAYTQ